MKSANKLKQILLLILAGMLSLTLILILSKIIARKNNILVCELNKFNINVLVNYFIDLNLARMK